MTEHLTSTVLRENRTGLSVDRVIKVYLPPSYATSNRAYPVVYYCHSLNRSPEQLLADGSVVRQLERGFADRAVQEFIFVVADYSTATLGSWFENSSTTGRWIDYTVQEVVPFIDGRYRTLQKSEGRGLAGDFVGGRGALRLAMLHPEMFSSVYAMHPVATGTGWVPMASRVDWAKIHAAPSFAELDSAGLARPFVSIMQAFLPNPDRPPLYCDFMVEPEHGELKLHPQHAGKLKHEFLLDHSLEEYAGALRQMRGIALDWARYDPNQDHVYSNQAFTRKLDELGIEHEAEEYRGDPWSKTWTDDGRFYTRVLPFFARNLAFQ